MSSRPPAVVALVVFLAALAYAVTATSSIDPPPADRLYHVPAPAAVVVVDQARQLELRALRAKLEREHRRLVTARRRVRQLTRTLQHRTSTREALELACTIYGNCSTLWRRAQCETGGTFSPTSYNHKSHASGLLQFLPSTWASTPFGEFSVFSPYANALAAGWMMTHGRGGEWVCR